MCEFAHRGRDGAMYVSVRQVDSGRSCVVDIPEGSVTVRSLKVDALNEMFAGSVNADREGVALAAHIAGREEELNDAEHVAHTGLEAGDGVKLVRRLAHVKAPAVYETPSRRKRMSVQHITLSRCGLLCSVTSDCGGYITVFDTRTADVVAHLKHGIDIIRCATFSVCGRWLATCSYDFPICVWLTATWEQVWCLEERGGRGV